MDLQFGKIAAALADAAPRVAGRQAPAANSHWAAGGAPENRPNEAAALPSQSRPGLWVARHERPVHSSDPESGRVRSLP